MSKVLNGTNVEELVKIARGDTGLLAALNERLAQALKQPMERWAPPSEQRPVSSPQPANDAAPAAIDPGKP